MTFTYAICYIPPQNSSVTQIDHIGDACSSLDILQKEVDLYDTKGDIALIGDFNSRTGNIQEVLHDIADMTDIHHQEIILDNKIPNRRNEDLTVNQYGKHLLNVIEQAHMIILNGRSLGDLQGSKTCHKYNGSSTVDYMIVSSGIWNKVITFRVLENDWYTDHSPLACHIRMNNPWPSPVLVEKLMPTTKYIWGEDSRDKVTLTLTEPCFIDRLHNVTLMDDTNMCTDTLTEILNDVAKISLVVKTMSPTQIGNKKTPEKSPIDPKLVSMKRDFKRAKRHYYNNKLDNNRRIEFIKQRNKYKKIKYLTERYQKDDKLYKLAMIENKQPNLFWKSIKSLMPKKNAESQIHSKDWISYFSELLNFRGSEETQNEGYQFREYIKHSLPVLEKGMPSVGPLDNNITEEEFIQAIRQLKNNKAVGPDNICLKTPVQHNY